LPLKNTPQTRQKISLRISAEKTEATQEIAAEKFQQKTRRKNRSA